MIIILKENPINIITWNLNIILYDNIILACDITHHICQSCCTHILSTTIMLIIVYVIEINESEIWRNKFWSFIEIKRWGKGIVQCDGM